MGGGVAAAPTCPEIKKARATPLRFALPLLLLVADALRPHLASASTTLPSSSELCPDETAACYESTLCWDCVAQFEDSSEYCEDRFPVLAAEDDDGCEAASALYCCSFDASGQDCLDDTVTVDYFRCGVLEGSGCDLSDSPCGGSSSSTTSPDDDLVTATSLSPDDDDESTTPADDDESADNDESADGDAWADDGDAWADDGDAWADDDDTWADDDDDSSPSDDEDGSQSADEENDDLGPDSGDNSGAAWTFAAPSRSSSAVSLWGALYCIVLVVSDALARI
ncbi:expressed unknown protein [Ectocarpus siliculosus]|uniref:Uncharacterized protein n=1 Tax=Ectocarpus siliculosus TaxID=2880 RepID=D8LS79_ECTSI|nr:expressed unknown protein [Ectocarpus siliculosus]|eukprot:CBN75136.1 expressed unknown protein [Ectocarpus siliculosus]